MRDLYLEPESRLPIGLAAAAVALLLLLASASDVRAGVDTNVLLSALFRRGRPHVLMEQVRAGALSLISSPALLAELAEVMNRPKFQVILARSNIDLERTLNELRRMAEIIDPQPLPASVIRSFGDKRTAALFEDQVARDFQGIARRAKRKLEAINAATRISDLAVPPSNRLEKLRRDLEGFYSVRINDQ